MRMPAEWEPHEATWIAWPHHEPDWPGKFEAIRWDYAEIVRALVGSERVEILCASKEVEADAVESLTAHNVPQAAYRTQIVPTDRSWLRDSAPTGTDQGWLRWHFNAWAKYDNYALDAKVPDAVAAISGLPLIEPRRPDNGGFVVMEGGALDVNGEGVILVTEECLLSAVQCRNPGLSREGYESIFRDYLGVRQTLWLGASCVGDDTHGHVDDVARFVDPDTIVLAYEDDPADENHETSVDNLRRLDLAGGDDDAIRIVRLPFPRPVFMDGQRLPASYANFYIANTKVLVPTFNDPADRIALNALAELFPDREVVGIHAVDLVWGFGTLHCLTQQQPRSPGR